ncbi:MAG: hypothetical protein RR933_03535, partial [Oscillospiraceae bacterium]
SGFFDLRILQRVRLLDVLPTLRQSAAVPPLPCRTTGKSAKRRDRPFANISQNAAVMQKKKSDVFLKYHGAKMGFVWYNNIQLRTAKLRRVPTPKGNSEWIK